MSLRKELDDLASALCKKATKEETPIEASTDALKAAAAYYAIREKVALKKTGDEEEESSDFNSFQADIHGASQEQPHGRPAQPPANRRRVTRAPN